ncbi:MAG TPA: lactate racemase domain-containing protein [Pirellulaceae bacterium]
MTRYEINYGLSQRLALEVPGEASVVTLGTRAAGPASLMTEQAVADALASPLGYPPFGAAMFPEDHLVIAVEHHVPGSAGLITAILHNVPAGTIAQGRVSVLLAPEAICAPELGRMIEQEFPTVAIQRHHPGDRGDLSYLAADREARPVYLNRSLCDADLVISVGCTREPQLCRSGGFPLGLFPTFSDQEARDRYRWSHWREALQASEVPQHDANEVNWLSGNRFVLRVVPAGQDGIAAVLAGDVDEVEVAATKWYRELWHETITRPVDLAVACLAGGPAAQTWDNLTRAIAAARRLVPVEGAIAVLSELDEMVPQQTPDDRCLDESVLESRSPQGTRRRRSPTPIRGVRSRTWTDEPFPRVYLGSRCDADAVEALEMIPLGHVSEIQALCGKARSIAFLENAQFTWPVRARRWP